MDKSRSRGYIAALFFITLSIHAVRCTADDISSPKGLALLLGVNTYQKGTFQNLNNPCNDIEFIANALTTIPTIKIFDKQCDLPAPHILRLVKNLHDELVVQPEGTFGLIYFAGHGLTVGEDVYLFGKQASPNVQDVLNRLKSRNKPNGELIPAFKNEDAVALLKDISPGYTSGNPVVIVIDACRTTPFGKEVKAAVPGSYMFQIQPNADTLIAFSAAHGSQALDSVAGLNVSPYAKALGDAIVQSDSSVADLFSVVRKNLKAILSADVSNRRQQPAELNALENRICLADCDTGPSHVAQKINYQKKGAVNLVKVSAVNTWDHKKLGLVIADNQINSYKPKQQTAASPMQRRFAETVWDIDAQPELASKLQEGKLGAMRIDVFWCESTSPSDSRVRASRAAEILTAFAQTGGTVGESILSKIRLRNISVEKNAEPGYRISSDLIRYFPGSELEGTWIKALREQLSVELGELVPSPVSTPTPGYMSIFFCSPSRQSDNLTPPAQFNDGHAIL